MLHSSTICARDPSTKSYLMATGDLNLLKIGLNKTVQLISMGYWNPERKLGGAAFLEIIKQQLF